MHALIPLSGRHEYSVLPCERDWSLASLSAAVDICGGGAAFDGADATVLATRAAKEDPEQDSFTTSRGCEHPGMISSWASALLIVYSTV